MIENKSLRSKIFDILNIVILIAITLICIVPVWYVLCVSLSSREAVNAGKSCTLAGWLQPALL